MRKEKPSTNKPDPKRKMTKLDSKNRRDSGMSLASMVQQNKRQAPKRKSSVVSTFSHYTVGNSKPRRKHTNKFPKMRILNFKKSSDKGSLSRFFFATNPATRYPSEEEVGEAPEVERVKVKRKFGRPPIAPTKVDLEISQDPKQLYKDIEEYILK